MNNYLKVVVFSLLVGLLCMIYFFKSNNKFTDVYAFQTGYFQTYNEALANKEQYPSSVIIPGSDGFYVVVAIYEDMDLINKMLVYYEEKDINVSIKKISCSNEFVQELNKYETLANNIEDKELYDKLNQNILDMYISTI